ncbi:MAG: tail fiber domain-containing protein [Bryobacteraceae bacterium]|jgi:hypothetical protein
MLANTSGYNNTATGVDALAYNTTGNSNTANGFAALASNTSGYDNTAAGVSALLGNTTGYANMASGSNALLSNTTGSYNTASGASALASNTTGSYNTASGFSALFYNTTGSYNIAIGPQAGNLVPRGSNYNIHIGSQGTISDAGTIRIGTPGLQTSFFAAGVNGVTIGLSGAVNVVVDGNGQLGTVSSSLRYKEDIADMGDASGDLLELRPVTFRYKKAYADGSKPLDYGLIAEEVAEVYPKLGGKDGQVETVQYQKLTPMLLNELQKLHRRHESDHQQLESAQEQIRLLESRLAALETRLANEREQ